MIALANTAKMLYKADAIPKRIVISFPSGNFADITNDNLTGSVSLKESICSSEFKFGLCEASTLEFECFDIGNFKSESIQTKIQIWDASNEIWIDTALGTHKVDECKRQANMARRRVTAYDSLYSGNLDKDVSLVVNALVAAHSTTPVTIYALKAAVLNYCGVAWDTTATPSSYETASLDITGYESQSNLCGRTVIQAIMEAQGKFGKIGRDGVFKEFILPSLGNYLYPSTTLYPETTLYPNCLTSKYDKVRIEDYKSIWYEEYQCKKFGKIQIIKGGSQLDSYVGDANITNTYVISGNWLFDTFTFSSTFLQTMLMAMWGNIEERYYTPIQMDCKGFPWIEAGDIIEAKTREGTVMSYAMQRRLVYNGGSALSDNYTSDGQESYQEVT